MAGPRPGSNAYDKQRARIRNAIDDSGRHVPDRKANDVANRILQQDRGQRGVVRGERIYGPKGEREAGDPR
ncbi:phosphatidylethanolamine-binding protein [Micromonospora sp. WMMA1363]|uniref:phosphatidylethanolamine-binding protein n=1 Tax=Micromonospora sp. WMMA1363 TaxID=3053985 RepID=UPI00259C6DCF|nr:phosphatidylethanolamine-binding protein [Micromonospora sp. WMMA1363]MDM4719111.1 phosphatidylethanolamine-binding protein [Micromonospora sp. WMMA1363]